MKTGNIIDFLAYKNQDAQHTTGISEELKSAIQSLIYQLREVGPLS